MKSLRLYLIISSVLLLVYLVAQFNRPKDADWTETFDSTSKAPFGTYIIYHRINDVFPGAKDTLFREPFYNVLNDHGIKHGTYLIVNNYVNLNESDYTKLVRFIRSGNDIFISASNFSEVFEKKLKIETATKSPVSNEKIVLKFTDKYLDSSKTYRIGKNTTNNFFDKFDTTRAVVLGKNNYNEVNFLKYSFGSGHLYLNANPLVFTNYSILNEEGGKYAATALSYVKNDKLLIWDQYYALGREDEGSSMRVFLRNEASRWAFYIAFFSLVLFVIYEIKRRQRIIPIIEPLENATLSFVNVVGQVYFEQHDNKNIADKKIMYFLEHLRVERNLKTNVLDKDFIAGFSQKTGVDDEFATELINYINYIGQVQKVTNNELIDLNKLIEQFYIKAR
jgi:hypothetical protein